MSTPTINQTIEEVHADFFQALEEMDSELMMRVATQYKEMGWDEEAEEARLLVRKWNREDFAFDNYRDNE